MRLALVGDEVGAPLGGQGGEQGGLAARSGAQVEPAHVATRQGRLGHRQRHDLGALVLHPGAALGHGRDARRVATRQLDGVRRPSGARAAGSLQLGDVREPGSGGERHPRGRVVGGEQGLEVGVVAQRLAQRIDDPARVGVRDGEVAVEVRGPVRRDLLDPVGERCAG